MPANRRRSAATIPDRGRPIEYTLLGTAFGVISDYLVVPRWGRVLGALWTAHTHVYRALGVSPRLDFAADAPGRGKTTGMQVVCGMSANPLIVGYSSQASVYNWLDEHPDSTIGLDQAENIFGTTGRRTTRDILLATLDVGYTPAGRVLVTRNGKAVQIPVFCPMALAGIGSLPASLADRAIIIPLTEGIPDETFLPGMGIEENLSEIGQQLAEWLHLPDSLSALTAFRQAQPLADVPGSARFRQIMGPLAAIANLADCYGEFLDAVRGYQNKERTPTVAPRHILFLDDLRAAWPGKVMLLRAAEIIDVLQDESRRWDTLSKTRVGELTVAGLLRESGIESKVRNGERGYTRADVFAGVRNAARG